MTAASYSHTKEYQDFVKQLRATEQEMSKVRRQAKAEGRTLEKEVFAKAIKKKIPVQVIEFGQQVIYDAKRIQQFSRRRASIARRYQSKGTTIEQLFITSTPYPTFSSSSAKRSNDLMKARRVSKPRLASVKKDKLSFQVLTENPTRTESPYYLVEVRLLDWDSALQQYSQKPEKIPFMNNVKQAVNGSVEVNCTCGRWRYWYRYKATVGGYALSKEHGYPKIRNASLQGSLCKHLIATLHYVWKSNVFHQLLAKHMEKQTERERDFEVFLSEKETELLKKSRIDPKMGAVKKAKEDAKQKAKLAKAKKKIDVDQEFKKFQQAKKAFLQKQKAAERKVQQAEGESNKLRNKLQAEQRKNQFEIAKVMKEFGAAENLIMQRTGLTKADLRNLD